MLSRILTGCVVILSILLPALAQSGRRPGDDSARPNADLPNFIDPGFEAFKNAPNPKSGWSSDDLLYPNDPRFGGLMMTPDSQIKAEGEYSLRIEQYRPRARNQGQAFLSQAVSLPKGAPRRYELSVQMRGSLNGPVTIHVYVWEPADMAHVIAQRDVKVNKEWKTTTISFNVPHGHDSFGLWFYLPRDDEAAVWLDDIRLMAKGI